MAELVYAQGLEPCFARIVDPSPTRGTKLIHMSYLGVIFALVAFLTWGFGDFFIQRTARVIGVWKALFFIGGTGAVFLLPFVIKDLPLLNVQSVFLLLGVTFIVTIASLFDFEALVQGKISIIDPLISLELPLTVGLSIFWANEQLDTTQFVLVVMVFALSLIHI